MRIGVPTEVKDEEYRVALTPGGARELTDAGHVVFVQSGAGLGSAITDDDYRRQNAVIVEDADEVFAEAELIVKVKEPQPIEVMRLGPHHVLFAYLHLAAQPELARALVQSGACCMAYETVEDARGGLPLLAPMSEVAGKIAAQAGAFILEKPLGGRGILLGGVPGVRAARVMIVGGGVVGARAASVAAGMGADVVLYDRDVERLRALDVHFSGRVTTCFSSPVEIETRLPEADLVIGAVLIRGAKAPCVISRKQLALMPRAAVLVDVSIDQGGCFESSRPTTHSQPTYDVDGITHYCVTNMPGAVPITSTYALTNATLPYILRLAELDRTADLSADPVLVSGLNVSRGKLTCLPVANSLGMPHTPPTVALRGTPTGRASASPASDRVLAEGPPDGDLTDNSSARPGVGSKSRKGGPHVTYHAAGSPVRDATSVQ